MFDFMQHGPLMAAADSGMGGGAGVADVSSDFGGALDAGGQGPDASEVHDAEFVEPGTEVAASEPGTALVKAGERAIQNGKFTGSGKAAIEAIKQLSPVIAKDAQNAFWVREWIRTEFPGGKKEIENLRQLATKNGGEQGIGELQSIAQQMQEIDTLYENSDPAFLDKITSTEAGQRSLIGLMPAALAKFEKLAPQQFAHHQAKAFTHLMGEALLPTTFATQAAILNRAGKAYTAGNFELASSFLSEIIENHNALHDFVQKIHESAKAQPPAFGATPNPQLNDREKQLSEREKSLQKQEWQSSVSGERKRLFSSSWAALTKGRTLTPDQDANIKGFYELRLTAKMKQWQNQGERFLANGDKDGYLKEQFAFFQKAIPEALRQAMQQAVPAKPGPKGGPLKPPIVARGTPAQQGAVRVAKMPPTDQLDPVRTTSAMFSENKAFTKDGRLVQWA